MTEEMESDFYSPQKRSDEENHMMATQLDCGDGVPTLALVNQEPVRSPNEPPTAMPQVTATGFAIGATVFGQLLIGMAVAAGGSPVVGVVAAVILLICGLALVAAETSNRSDRNRSDRNRSGS